MSLFTLQIPIGEKKQNGLQIESWKQGIKLAQMQLLMDFMPMYEEAWLRLF